MTKGQIDLALLLAGVWLAVLIFMLRETDKDNDFSDIE